MKLFENDKPTREFFIFLKYNKIPSGVVEELSKNDEELYKEFVNKFQLFNKQISDDNDSAIVTSSSLFSMFGFNRHYCSMTGKPILGKYYKISGKIVSKEAYDSYKIIQEMENKGDIEASQLQNKSFNDKGKKRILK